MNQPIFKILVDPMMLIKHPSLTPHTHSFA